MTSQPDTPENLETSRNVLVFGGTGAVGSSVLRALAKRGLKATFTYLNQQDKAKALGDEYGHRGFRLDLGNVPEVRAFLDALETRPDAVIHCAAISASRAVEEVDDDTWRRTMDVNATSAFLVGQYLAKSEEQGGDVVFVGALGRSQSLPLPVHFAASQGALSAMTMALSHELGHKGIRVNLLTLGVMSSGLSESLATENRRDYEKFSALRRVGTPEEAANAICWLALENSYISGKVLPVNGGI